MWRALAAGEIDREEAERRVLARLTPAGQRRWGDRLYRADLIARYGGRRSVAWLAGQLSLAPRTVANICYREGLSPTDRDDLLTTGHAADLLGVSPQTVAAWCRRGRLSAWPNPGGRDRRVRGRHRWWLIPREAVQRLIASGRYPGARKDDPRLTDPTAWPRVVVAQRGGR